MEISSEIVRSLRILGLSSDATAVDVRRAFRRLAKTCHPDVVGRRGARRFEQIAGAYAFLRSLPPEQFPKDVPEPVEKTPSPNDKSEKKVSGWYSPLFWRRIFRERSVAKEGQTPRIARDMEEKNRQAREFRIEQVLSRGERTLGEVLSRMREQNREVDTRDLVLRLLSDVPDVRRLALSRLGDLSNRKEVLDALVALLSRWEIDEKTAFQVMSLPLEPKNCRKLTEALTERASALPDSLLIFLLHLRGPGSVSRELLERYVRNASAGGVVLILRYWPSAPFPFISPETLRVLLAREDEAVLVPLLATLKQRAVPCLPWGEERLKSLLSHPGVAVRVWAKSLLPQKTG
ncbi:MAG: DnaJ domain-containing protein [Synergistaceae bacterium]|jgi:hypothetical protein|nr:DnaJ domain-containing protein [Synergistaceae bacterium]